MAEHFNPNEIVTMTQIMAVNGDCPKFGGWVWSEGYAGGQERLNGVLGEKVRQGDSVYVCVQACTTLRLSNNHPDYTPACGTVWVYVPRPENIDWRYVPVEYRSRDGWRVKK